MPRSIWSGTISFGLVSVPVKMFSAVQSHDLHFNYVHAPDGSRIGYEKVCKQEGKPVPDDEIVKAFEYEQGEWVYMEDEDFRAAETEGLRAIDISDFVEYAEIDPIYFEKTYYLAPQDGSEKVYALLHRALDESGLAGIAKFVMRDRQHLGCLRVRDGAIVLERMHFADEIREPDEVVDTGGAKVEKRELEMARQLIEQFRGEFDPSQYRDTYRDALCGVIRAKRRGEEVHAEPAPKAEQPTDLMAALRASIEAAQGRRGRNGKRNGGSRGDGGLASLTKEELLERAREVDLPGRSSMSKEELVEALAG